MNKFFRLPALLGLLFSPAAFAIPQTNAVVISEPASPILLLIGLFVMMMLIALRNKTAVLRIRYRNDDSVENDRY